jgi:hypothetical protein
MTKSIRLNPCIVVSKVPADRRVALVACFGDNPKIGLQVRFLTCSINRTQPSSVRVILCQLRGLGRPKNGITVPEYPHDRQAERLLRPDKRSPSRKDASNARYCS